MTNALNKVLIEIYNQEVIEVKEGKNRSSNIIVVTVKTLKKALARRQRIETLLKCSDFDRDRVHS